MNLIQMRIIAEATKKRMQDTFKKSGATVNSDLLHHLAFDNSLQANIIFTVSTGKVIIANRAACKLLGYSKKELLTKSRSAIFDINERSFKKMLKQKTAEGHSTALVTAIKKSGRQFPCEITSAVFMDENNIATSITTIADRSQSILKQKNFDTKNEKVVANNIVLAKSKQKEIDAKKEKIVADNIILAKSKQKKIDSKNEKLVADNVVLAKSKQKEFDIKKERIVADNIVLAHGKLDARLEENDNWIRYIAKTSYEVMWDWEITTGEVYVGDSIEEVFGYKVQFNILNIKNLRECLLPEEKITVEKKLKESIASGNKTWNDSFMFRRHDGSLAATASRASIVRDIQRKAIRMIGATQDISRLRELEKKLEKQITIQEENSEKFLLAAKLSVDVIWDWNLLTNEMFIDEGFEELFGYSEKNNKGNIADCGNHLHPDDKEAVKRGLQDAILSSDSHWEHAYRFIRADGSIAAVIDRAIILRHADGKAYRIIGAMQDHSREKELEDTLQNEIADKAKLLAEYKERFRLIFNSSSDILFDADLEANEIIISDAYEKEFGYKTTGKLTSLEDRASHIHPDDKKAVLDDYLRMLASEDSEWKYSYRFLRADDSVVNILHTAIILRNSAGMAYRMIGSLRDISRQKLLEESLKQEIEFKEEQIAEAMEKAKENERSDIGKELHDNVNQLLAASRLYVEMAKQGGEEAAMYLSNSSEYTLTAIEEIRKLTKGLTTDTIKSFGLYQAIENVTRDTMDVTPIKISFTLEQFREDSVTEKFKLNVFRILQEQLNNILKHAKATEVTISLIQNKKTISLLIADNGVGFDTAIKQKGIGLENIKNRAAYHNGTAAFVSKPGQSCVLTVTFPVKDVLLNKI